jgi:hypothetical protein
MPEETVPRADLPPLAVIDIGSNSGRVVVYRVEADGGLRIQATTRAALRLVREVDVGHVLSAEAIERTLEALRDFRAISAGAGAQRIVAVATAALRDAENAPALLERIRTELGLEVQIISGEQEAWYGFVGAVTGLPVEHGVLFDLGGGSMQLTRFRERRRLTSWSLPLGSLRLSGAFLASDPPKGAEIRRLHDHVRRALEEAGMPRLTTGEALVGTGGTVRNLAKIDRRTRDYPIQRVHGYVITAGRLKAVVSMLAAKRAKERRAVPGLNEDRGDSIVGGSLAVQTLAETLEARELQVSGPGRAGRHRPGRAGGRAAPPARRYREGSLRATLLEVPHLDEATAARRAAPRTPLLRALEPGASPELREGALRRGPRPRHRPQRGLLRSSRARGGHGDGDGSLRLLPSRPGPALRHPARPTGDEDSSVRRYSPLLTPEDAGMVGRAAALLALADDIEERCPPGAPMELQCESGRQEVKVTVRRPGGWRPRGLADASSARSVEADGDLRPARAIPMPRGGLT